MNLQELLENIFKSEEGKEKNITDFLSKISGIDKSNINICIAENGQYIYEKNPDMREDIYINGFIKEFKNLTKFIDFDFAIILERDKNRVCKSLTLVFNDKTPLDMIVTSQLIEFLKFEPLFK